jgi:hypothetical protein
MKFLLRRAPSASMVVAVAALIVAASGTAIAASNLVNGDNLIKTRSLSGNRLRNHSVTGTQVNLSKLGKVPSAKNADRASIANSSGNAVNAQSAANATNATNATHAGSAAALDNLKKLSWRVPANTAAQQIYVSPGNKLTVTATCGAANAVTLTFTTGVDHAAIQSYGNSADLRVDDFVAATPQSLTNAREERTLVYTEPGGQTVNLTYVVDNATNMPGVGCLLNGSALALP